MAIGDDPDQNAQTGPPPDLAALGEDGLIRRISARAPAADPQIIRGIGDDAAVIVTGPKTVVTTDLLIEDVHFRFSTSPPRLLGRKAMAVNLSDIAAMAATPRFAFLGIAAPGDFPAPVMDEIISGFLERAHEAEVALVGGDTCRADKLFLAVTLIGNVEPPGPVYRAGARPDDLIFVTGAVGDSALGLLRLEQMPHPVTMRMIEDDPLRSSILRHLDPPARLAAGQKLASLATSMMDLSDGLIKDLPRLLLESGGLGAVIETARIPLSDPFREHFRTVEHGGLSREALQAAIAGGEDYELIFTAPAEAQERIARVSRALSLSITRIGRITPEPGLVLLDSAGQELAPPSMLFEHFVSQSQGPKT